MTERGIVEKLLLLQCESRLAGPPRGHLESSLRSPLKDAEEVLKGSFVIYHTVGGNW